MTSKLVETGAYDEYDRLSELRFFDEGCPNDDDPVSPVDREPAPASGVEAPGQEQEEGELQLVSSTRR